MAVRYDVPIAAKPAPRTQRAYATKGIDGQARRPLEGPDSHPFLRVTARLYDRILGRLDPEAAIDGELRRVVRDWGRPFADVVGWALRERLRHRVVAVDNSCDGG